jgi:hypothetical protein
MSKFWRRIAPVAVAGGLLAASGALPAEAASPAAYSVTISAKVKFPKVTGDTLVIYRVRQYDTAAIHGQVTGATTGDVATLLSEPFGARHFKATGTPITLTGAAQHYSFTVQPSVATKYEVQVKTASKVDVTSGVQTVYVTIAGIPKGTTQKCSRTRCTFSYHVYTTVPVSAYRAEAAKHVYLYLAVGYPRLPNAYTLSTSARASKASKVRTGEFVQTFTFFIPLHGATRWTTNFCSKDTESRDGIGLPGHHGCGDKKVTFKEASLYLG